MNNNNRGWTKGPDAHELYVEAMESKQNALPKAKCAKCGSENLKDTGSFIVEIHKCQNCGELYCQDSAGIGCE